MNRTHLAGCILATVVACDSDQESAPAAAEVSPEESSTRDTAQPSDVASPLEPASEDDAPAVATSDSSADASGDATPAPPDAETSPWLLKLREALSEVDRTTETEPRTIGIGPVFAGVGSIQRLESLLAWLAAACEDGLSTEVVKSTVRDAEALAQGDHAVFELTTSYEGVQDVIEITVRRRDDDDLGMWVEGHRPLVDAAGERWMSQLPGDE